MVVAGVGSARAQDMGHIPIGGPEGSLARLSRLPKTRTVYLHINNTNPILREDSSERAAVEAAGAEVGYDGLDITI